MPLKLLNHLDGKAETVRGFSKTLAESTNHLARAEAAWRSYERSRAKILEDAPKFYELMGVAAGLKIAGPVILQHQTVAKNAIESGGLGADAGKQVVHTLGRAASSILQVVEDRVLEKRTEIGKLQGVYWAAIQELDEIVKIVAHFEKGKEIGDGDEDWSGRGGNGQRDVADVVPLEAVRSSRNGSKKKPTRRKATKRKPRKKPNEAATEASPGVNGES